MEETGSWNSTTSIVAFTVLYEDIIEVTEETVKEDTSFPATSLHDFIKQPEHIIMLSVGGAVFVTIVVVVCCCIARRIARTRPSIVEDFWISRRPISTGPPIQIPKVNTLMMENLFVESSLKEEITKILIDTDQLQIGTLIGKGEFGCVNVAKLSSKIDGKIIDVAVKSIRDKYKMCELEDFLREGAMTNSLNHENILQVIGIAIKTSPESDLLKPLVVMPLMKHGDLRTYLHKIKKRNGRKNFSVSQLVEFALHIARGMSFLSKKNYVHRDLAARNCMLHGEKDNYTVKIADFGLARKVYASNYQMKKLTKLPFRWLAPEALRYFKFTQKTDVWAFGVTIWEIFSFGDVPYPGIDNSELLKYLSNNGRLRRPVNCPDKMWDVIEDCWKKNPPKRPTFDELERRIEEIFGERCSTYIPIRNSYRNIDLQGSSEA